MVVSEEGKAAWGAQRIPTMGSRCMAVSEGGMPMVLNCLNMVSEGSPMAETRPRKAVGMGSRHLHIGVRGMANQYHNDMALVRRTG
jgi:hypothetical protein